MKHMKRAIAFLLGLCTAYGGDTCAQESAARFLLWKPSAVSNDMGGVGVTQYKTTFVTFHNPAGVAFGPSIGFAGSLAEPFPHFGSSWHSFLALSGRKEFLGVAVSVNRIAQSVQAVTSPFGEIIGGDKDAVHWHGKLSVAAALSENLSAGVSLGYFR